MAAPIGKGASSTIVTTPLGSSNTSTIQTRSGLGVRQTFFTGRDLQDPEALYRVLHAMNESLTKALSVIGQSSIVSANRITGLTFTAGQTLTFNHGLGRPYQGWWPVRALVHVAQLVEVPSPAGMSADLVLSLSSALAGTYDVMVF